MRKREVTIRYSDQAKKLIKELKSFDGKAFEDYFFSDESPYTSIGDGHILDFIFNRKAK